MGPDEDLRWFNEVYLRRFPSEAAMVADLDQQLARFNDEHPAEEEEDTDTFCPMCGPTPCRHADGRERTEQDQ
jgi:thiamine biosynthesis protein ThiC